MKNETVEAMKRHVYGEITRLSVPSSRGKAVLARLRRAVGKPPGLDPELWAEVLGGLPDGMIGYGSRPSRAEWSIHTALTLYAIHVQSSDGPAHVSSVCFGEAVGRLALSYGGGTEDRNPYQTRMAEAARAGSIEVLSWRLRGLIRLLGQAGIGFDYGRLAENLFWFQGENSRPGVIRGWGRDYMKAMQKTKNKISEGDAV